MATIDFDHVKYGKKDACVKTFQKALIAKGHKIPDGPTENFGKQTKDACTAFQKKQGWTGAGADGVPGPQTFALLGLKDGGHKKSSTDTGSGSGGKIASPVPGHGINTGNPYGAKGSYSAGFHTGDDYPALQGTKVVAVRAGTIATSDDNGGSYGKWVVLRADNGRDYYYCHLSKRSVAKGAKVKAGDKLGEVGSTGNSTGPHLHFEDRPEGGGYGNVRKPKW
ncbi:peptidoglycan DD-metalloendopeptidase family protein [Streptomyces sp. NPDC093085]|uniref:peptidoglycan DD-metalloendopeptidase family protein n=1 Tax=Streptomyces sp. NPDC093085 TaxID=3155068 RepID=UPI003441C127